LLPLLPLLPLGGYGSQTLVDDVVADVRDAMRALRGDAATLRPTGLPDQRADWPTRDG
jgi:hypothetical protein